ncbi:hypothetical protein BpHYR1_013066 [Brachionus plicatilis]|uniref:Uncharacterized protein n=1 Tax=Brachionus plicatilis TaxID=10195 RepID=A0A3M7RUI7_BRAPC|nr:hypothetical protein BpHYR1_013066 [Brachionus plicatilis]
MEMVTYFDITKRSDEKFENSSNLTGFSLTTPLLLSIRLIKLEYSLSFINIYYFCKKNINSIKSTEHRMSFLFFLIIEPQFQRKNQILLTLVQNLVHGKMWSYGQLLNCLVHKIQKPKKIPILKKLNEKIRRNLQSNLICNLTLLNL